MKRIWATVVVLAGCTGSPPPYEEPELGVEVPARWSTSDAMVEPVVVPWWTTIDDQHLGPLIVEALEHNHDLQAAAARVDAAAALARVAGAPLYPAVDLLGDASRQRQNFIGFPIPGGGGSGVAHSTFNRFGVSLVASWELDLWGRIRSGHAAALADVQASVADWAWVEQSLAAQTARAYFEVIEVNLQLQLGAETVALFTRTADLVADRFARGIRSPLDLRLARSDVAVSEAAVARQRERLDRAERQLELLLGRYPAGVVASAEDLPEVPERVPAGLPAELLRRRPDVIAAERTFAATTARIDQAVAALFPTIALTAQGGTASEEFHDLFDSDLFFWNVAANLVQPIFEGGRLEADVELARAQARQAAAQYAGTALRAYGEVETTLAVEETLRSQARYLRDAEREARAALELADERYRGGLDDILTLLDSQRRVVTAASEQITVRRLILDVRVDLHLALGGGFEGLLSVAPGEKP